MSRNEMGVPDPEVVAMAERWRFGEGYKLRTLLQAEQCAKLGRIGVLL